MIPISIRAVTLVLVISLCACTRGASPAPGGSHASARPAWQAPGTGSSVLETWSVASELVVAADTGVTAYDRASGRQLWRMVPPPIGSSKTGFCGASQSVVNETVSLGVGLVTRPGAVECHSVGVLDLGTRKLRWVHTIPSATQIVTEVRATAGSPALLPGGIVTEIVGQTVLAGWKGVAAGFSLSDGKPQWSTVPGTSGSFVDYSVQDFAASGSNVYMVVGAVLPQALELRSIDPASGRTVASTPLTPKATGLQKPADATVVATAPLTLLAQEIPGDAPNFLVFDDALRVARIIPAGSQNAPNRAGHTLYTAALNSTNPDIHRRVRVVVGGGLLIAATEPADDGPPPNPVVAYDTSTGARRWSISVPDVDILAPVAIDGSNLLVVGGAHYGQGDPVLIRLDLASGQNRSVKSYQVGRQPIGGPLAYFGFTWTDGRVYGVNWGQTLAEGNLAPGVIAFG